MVVQHNMQAMNSNRMLGITSKAMAKVTEKLASGYKVNRAADDAAGLAISEKMRKQIRGLTQASLNAQDGISAVQTAEGALGEVHDMIQRMNELAVKSANGTNSQEERDYIQLEVDKLTTEIDRVAETTKFNELYLLKGDSKNPSSTQEMTMSGTRAGMAIKGDASPAEIAKTEWTFTATLTANANMLAAGTKENLEISYLDKDGNAQIKKVEFTVDGGKNTSTVSTDQAARAKVTANNIAKAINDDKDLSAIFTATAVDGTLTIKSVDDDDNADRTAAKITATKFDSELATAATQKLTFGSDQSGADDPTGGGTNGS